MVGKGASAQRLGAFSRTIPRDAESIVGTITFALVGLFILSPVLALFYGSVRSDAPGAPGAHFTLGNWSHVYATTTYHSAFVNTIVLSGAVALLSLILGAMLAWIIARTDAPGRAQLAPLLLVPLMISNLVTTLAWIALCAPNAGFVNVLARNYLSIRTLFDVYSVHGMVLVLVLHYASFAFIPIYAALRSIDGSLEEASYMLGGGPLRTALRMTLPLIWPTLAATFMMIFVFVSENFAVPTLLGSTSGFHTMATWIFYHMSVEPSKPALAATVGTTLLWIALAGTVWQRQIIARARRYETIAGKGSRHRVTRLGRWRYVATGLVVFYLFLAVLLPYLTLIFASFLKFVTPRLSPALLTSANYMKLLSWDYVLPIRNSMMLAILGGGGATLLYVFLAYLIKRSTGWPGQIMDYLVIVPTVMPALVLGVGFVWTYIYVPLPIYGTMSILVIAYFARYVGQGVRQSRAAFVQVSEELPEAARVCGASPLRAFKEILLPLLTPHLISLWTLLFIFIFMEISVTIVLYSATTLTLPVLLWSRMVGGDQTEAFTVAVLQATIVFVVLYVANRLFGTLRSGVAT